MSVHVVMLPACHLCQNGTRLGLDRLLSCHSVLLQFLGSALAAVVSISGPGVRLDTSFWLVLDASYMYRSANSCQSDLGMVYNRYRPLCSGVIYPIHIHCQV